ncbi:MAG: electron transfer flavoprotein-ubiquinone oxidoreductase [Chromatiaceae bacterium]|nr:electron transfer flavoprotein-ubiquinone oxidoreductase [Chromatiaceae bacterium]MCP5447934.1 electron transfer flavoprotein-ubiquinone oxidoreductase [Chromatiaceae bacterium]
MQRETMEFDVVIVGAGPAGLAAACRLMQLGQESGNALEVCVLEKGSEVGSHILSGAVLDPKALHELFPEWQKNGAPLNTPVTEDRMFLLKDAKSAVKFPGFLVPPSMHNQNNYIISMGNLCRWLAEQAEAMGVNLFPGFPAAELIMEGDCVKGVITGDMGRAADGSEKDSFEPGMELRAKYVLFAEGSRGHLGKQLIRRFSLDQGRDPQHYGIGIKELWEIPAESHQPGLVVHGSGWPLEKGTNGGWFLYHMEERQVAVGLIVDLNYPNPYLSPFDEFQRLKLHPVLRQHLEGGKRITYGARALTKGGLNCLPKMSFPGGLLIGCDAGTLNFAKIKGGHTAMKSGMLAAETVHAALSAGSEGCEELSQYEQHLRDSWLYAELHADRNFGPALHKFGPLLGGSFNWIEQVIFRGKLPLTLHDTKLDHQCLKPAAECTPIEYPKPDGKLSFDKLSSVYLSNTNHEENQPCHLKLADPDLPLRENLPRYAEPAQRYCPAGVYEVLQDDAGNPVFRINSQNCVHCKTCDIKDPAQNITWVTPEGSGGPNYPNM